MIKLSTMIGMSLGSLLLIGCLSLPDFGTVTIEPTVPTATSLTSTTAEPPTPTLPTTPTSTRQPEVTLALVGQIGGVSDALAVQGRYAYLGVGHRLVVVDVANPSTPQIVGQSEILPGMVRGVALRDRYAYVAVGFGGLWVLDISEPLALRVIGSVDTPGNALGVTVVDDYAYVADGEEGLQVIAVSNPAAPHRVGFIDTPAQAKGIVVVGDYAYVADSDGGNQIGGLRIVDVSDPTALHLAGSFNTGDAWGVSVSGNYAYVVAYGLRVLDISEPANPRQAGFLELGNLFDDIAVVDGYAFISSNRYCDIIVTCPRIVQAIDITNPSVPSRASDVSSKARGTGMGTGRGLVVLDGLTYVATDTGLQVLAVSGTAKPTLVGEMRTLGPAIDVTVLGKYAYVVDGDHRLSIIDVEDPAKSSQASVLLVTQQCEACLSSATETAVENGYAYLNMGEDGLRVVDVHISTQPRELSTLELRRRLRAMAVTNRSIYVVSDGLDDIGLHVVETTDPSQVREVGFLAITDQGQLDIAATDDYAYVVAGACGENGCQGSLNIIDLTESTVPRQISDLAIPGYGAVAVAGNYAYTTRRACYYGGCSAELGVIDVSNPTKPRQVSALALSTGGRDVVATQDYVYVLGDVGLRVIDVTNPTQPREVGAYNTSGWALGMTVADDHVYIADMSAGLLVLQVTPVGSSGS